MNWDDARYFLAVAREGQMLGTARRLSVSQALLSRRVASLERALGATLLDRTTRGCTLTEDGQAVFEAAKRMEAEMMAATARVQGQGNDVSGTIRIGAPDGFGSAFLAPRLGRIQAACPGLHIQLVPVSRSFSLSQREADVAVMIGRPDKGRLRVRRLTDYTLGLYASQDYLAAAGTPGALVDLNDHALVGYVEDLIFTPELNYAVDLLRDWRSTIEVSTAIGQLEAVRSGAGVGILHDFMAARHKNLVRVLPDQTVTRTYWTVWHENLRVAPRVQAIVKLIDDLVREDQRLFRRSA